MQDIYQITFPGSQLDHIFVHGIVAEAGDEPVKARILLMDPNEEDEIIGVYNTNEATGKFLMLLSNGAKYVLMAEAPGFIPQRMELIGKADGGEGREMTLNIQMVPTPDRERLTRQE